MTLDQASSPDTTEKPIDGTETPSSGEVGVPPASPGSALTRGLVTIRRWTRRCLARWRAVLAAVLVVAAMGVAVSLFFIQYRPDRQVDEAAAHQAIQAASDGAVALLSYSFDSLDRDFAAAKSHLTGNFLAYYSKFSEQIAAGALQGQLTTTAKVIRAAVSDLHPDPAVVLVFVNQTTTSKRKPEPLEAHSSILVTLTKVNGSWLITNFDPVG
jgi:Mce-associated membrane protein